MAHRTVIAATVALAVLVGPPAMATNASRTPSARLQFQCPGGPDPKEVQAALTWLRPYFEIVRTYRRGEAESALRQLRSWWWGTGNASVSRVHLQTIAQATRFGRVCGTGSPPLSADLIAGAVMLHTEEALAEFDANVDSEAPAHIARAVELLGGFSELIDAEAGLARDEASERFTRRAWFQGMAQTLQGRWKIDMANAVVDEGLAQVRQTDPTFLLAAGSVKEALAFAVALWPEQAGQVRVPETFRRSARISRDPAVHRRKAAELFRQVLAGDPEVHEASVRLGRVLVLLGQGDDAAQTLAALLAHETHAEPPLMYLAHLFLGGAREQQGRLADAAAEYRAAIAIEPKAQVARVALARALERTGNVEAVVPTLRPFLEIGGLRETAEDPWWLYPFGRPEEGYRVLTMLQRAVTVQ